MRARSVLTLGVGFVLAGAAVYMADQQIDRLISQQPQVVAAQPEIALGRIVVADRELRRGDLVRAEFLKEVDWPVQSIPENALTSIAEIVGEGDEAATPRRVRRSLVKGEPVLAEKISGFGGRDTLGETVDPGKRAVSIRVNDVSGVSGFMLPGDRVDVLLTRKREDGRDNDDLITDVVLQSVRILAIDQLTDEQREKPQIARTATVEVTTYQAQKLALAMQVGTLSLALRNVVALEEDTTRRVRVADLVETKSQVARPKAPSVVVRRGAQTSVQNVGLP